MTRIVFLVTIFAACAFAASSIRGARVFEKQQCGRCHSLKRIGRSHTPAVLAGTLWNHAPAMWAEMGRQGIAPPALTEEDAADLFAYFYSARFFDLPGDPGGARTPLLAIAARSVMA